MPSKNDKESGSRNVTISGNVYGDIHTGDTIFAVSDPNLLALPLESYIEKDFVGRDFVFAELKKYLNTNNRGYFVITGVPGIGKTSLAAHLIQTRILANTTYVYHFNDELAGVVQAEKFLKNICGQLIERYGTFRPFDPEKDSYDGIYLKLLLNHVSAALSNRDRVIIVVDALDEAQTIEAGPNRLYLPDDVPKSIYFVVTTRPLDKQPLIVSCPRGGIDLVPDSGHNLDDVRSYIKLYLDRGALRERLQRDGMDTKEFITSLEMKSEGNFMYLYYVLPEVERGDLGVNELPQGLESYYERHWQKLKSRNLQIWVSYQEPVLRVLAALPEFLTPGDIAELSPGLISTQVAAVIAEWRPFLRQRDVDGERRYRLYHLTFQEFLRKKEEVGELDLGEARDNIIEKLKQWWKPTVRK